MVKSRSSTSHQAPHRPTRYLLAKSVDQTVVKEKTVSLQNSAVAADFLSEQNINGSDWSHQLRIKSFYGNLLK
ncbi:hypothetical protein SLE2022_103920 [Rubroshorea leprosula]